MNTGSLIIASASAAATFGTSSAAAARTSIGINAVIIARLSRSEASPGPASLRLTGRVAIRTPVR